MNPRSAGLLGSAVIHFGLVVVFLSITFRTTFQTPKLIEVEIASESRLLDSQPLPSLPQRISKAAPAVFSPGPSTAPAETPMEPQAPVDEHFDAAAFFATPLTTLRIEPKDSLKPTVDGFHKKNEPLLFTRPGPYDPVERDMARRNLGAASLPDPSQAAAAAASLLQPHKDDEEKPVRLDFIPSPAELAVLQSVWEKPNCNDVEIYASLDSSIRITAEELQGVLEKLTAKRLLRRRLISPRNELTLPFGAAVEMSAQNRRNRLYTYEAEIDQQEIIRFLNAVLYELEHGDKAAGKDRRSEIEALKARLLQASR